MTCCAGQQKRPIHQSAIAHAQAILHPGIFSNADNSSTHNLQMQQQVHAWQVDPLTSLSGKRLLVELPRTRETGSLQRPQ